MRVMFWVLVAVTVFSLYNLVGNSKAMDECLKNHSYDVCYTTLNR